MVVTGNLCLNHSIHLGVWSMYCALFELYLSRWFLTRMLIWEDFCYRHGDLINLVLEVMPRMSPMIIIDILSKIFSCKYGTPYMQLNNRRASVYPWCLDPLVSPNVHVNMPWHDMTWVWVWILVGHSYSTLCLAIWFFFLVISFYSFGFLSNNYIREKIRVR